MDVPRKLQDPWYLRLRHRAASVSAVTTPPPTGDAHRTHTPQRKENLGGRGSGEARSGLTTQAHGDPRKYLQVEVPRRPEAPGVTGRYRGPQKAGSMCSQHGVGDRGESPGGMLRPRPLPAEQPAAE